MIKCIFFVWGAFGREQRLAIPFFVHLSAVSPSIDLFGTFVLVKLTNRICMTFVRHGQSTSEEVHVISITGVWRIALESSWF